MIPSGGYPAPAAYGSPVAGQMVQPEPTTAQQEEDKPKVHVITLHPHGMPRPFDVPFSERRLPVCDRCKKNYKSRDLCRTRDGHKTLPWTTAHVAITIDKSLIVQDSDGRATYADVPTIGLLMDTPLMCLGPADGSMKSEPICKVCREKNYTKDYCRTTCKHTTPPWNTTYVKIVADTRNAEERNAGYGVGGRKHFGKKRKKNPEDEEDGKMNSDEAEGIGGLGAFEASYEGQEKDVLSSDDLGVIHQSRTFLAAVSSKSVIVKVSWSLICGFWCSCCLFMFLICLLRCQWCERIQYPESAENTTLESAFRSVKDEDDAHDGSGAQKPDPGVLTGVNGGGGASQQALWDAFRAGAMWAQQQAAAGYGGYGMPAPGMFYGQPPPVAGEVPREMPPAGPWGGGGMMYPGYGPMNGGGPVMPPQQPGVVPISETPLPVAPQDWNTYKNSFRNKNPDGTGCDEDDGEDETQDL